MRVSNEAINASYDYTANEIDLFIKIIAHISRETDPAKRAHLQLTYQQLAVDQSASHSNYDVLRAAFRGLLSKPIEIYYRETQNYFISALINAVDIQTRSSIIRIDIHPKMINIICDMRSQYTTMQLASVLGLKGKYSKRLYLLCCQFIGTGVRYCSYIELRKIFKIEKKYDDVSDFKKRVLDPAIKEISAVTEIDVKYENMRNGRRLDQFVLTVKLNTEATKVAGLDRQRQFMQNCGLSEWQIDNVCAIMAPEEIHRVLYEFSKIKPTIKNTGGYLVTTFANLGVTMNRKIGNQVNLIDQIKYHEQTN
jgi:plasmid replication initiation protein